MIDLLNHLEYDAWVVGNHEFDWGMECFERAMQQSNMPVLAANMLMEGKLAGEFPDAKHPFAKISPSILKELAGIKIAIIGVTTPGMRFWLWPEFTRGLDFRHPVGARSPRHREGEKRGGARNCINRSYGTQDAHRWR